MSDPAPFDTSVANPARVYDFLIGGKDNFAADRAVAEAMTEAMPAIPAMLRANRALLARAVRYLVAERGLGRFLDIGSGLPTVRNVHQLAHDLDPDARVVYVDNDPMVAAHSRALLAGAPGDGVEFVQADAREPQRILDEPAVATLLAEGRPVAMMFISVLMYFPDAEAERIVAQLVDGLPVGSHVVISHPASDFDPAMSAAARQAGGAGGIGYHPRDRAGVVRLLSGLELLDPGVVPLSAWRPHGPVDPDAVHYWVGVAMKS